MEITLAVAIITKTALALEHPLSVFEGWRLCCKMLRILLQDSANFGLTRDPMRCCRDGMDPF